MAIYRHPRVNADSFGFRQRAHCLRRHQAASASYNAEQRRRSAPAARWRELARASERVSALKTPKLQ
jgi:hypothetical protein